MDEQPRHNQSERVAAMITRLGAAQSPSEQAAVVAEMAFEQMTKPMALVARHCVILRWFNEDVVAALLPGDSALTAAEVLSTLRDLPFIERTTRGWRYHDQTQDGLLQALPPELLRKSATLAASALQELTKSDAALERLYCLVVSGAQALAISLLDDLLLAHGRRQDWQGLSIVLQTVEEAESLYFVDALTRSALHYVASGLTHNAKGELDQAIADYDKAIELNPECASAYYNRGIAQYEKGELGLAIADCDKAIELNSKDASAYIIRGLVRSDKEELSQAIADYDKALDLNPQFASAYIIRGIARRVKGELAQAIADYDKAIELNPEDASAYIIRSLARSEQGELEDAIADYDKAIELSPEIASAYTNGGNVLSQLKAWSEAKSSFQKALNLSRITM